MWATIKTTFCINIGYLLVNSSLSNPNFSNLLKSLVKYLAISNKITCFSTHRPMNGLYNNLSLQSAFSGILTISFIIEFNSELLDSRRNIS